jgi:hypothetical protein
MPAKAGIHLLRKAMDRRVIRAFTPVFDGLCPAMTIFDDSFVTHFRGALPCGQAVAFVHSALWCGESERLYSVGK